MPKPNVLMVDDINANLVALEGVLADMGCNLVRARSGNDALRELLRQEFAVILLDVQMPSMDGYEVARFARGDPATSHVPIIFLTAKQDSEASMMRGYGSGAVDFLLKPINATVLRAKVHVFIDVFRSRQALAAVVDAHRKTLEQLEFANTALRDCVQVAAQDLRAPLRTVRGSLENLVQEVAPKLDVRHRDLLERAFRASLQMDSLLSSQLALACNAPPREQK